MKPLYAISSFLSLAVLLAASSCTASLTDDPDTTARAIAFSTPEAGTRAAVNSSAGMGDFSVWGWYGGSVDNVFDDVTVHAPSWTYDGGNRYWIPGETYNFYAVHPASLPAGTTADVSSDGIIIVRDFDCSKTGSEAVDLMTATATGLKGSEAPTVGLKFGHELAQVKVSVESNGATVDEMKVYGVSYKGNFNSGSTPKWTVTETAEENTTPLSGTTELDMLLLPVPESGLTDAKLKITYHYGSEASTTRTNEASLAIAEGWTAGQQYHYKVSIVAGKLTITVTVAGWKEEDTSVSW